MPFYSPSTGGFYTTDIHGDAMPGDVVEISEKRHLDLMAAQAIGSTIVNGPKGPTARKPGGTKDDLLAIGRRKLRIEARRRVLAVASLEKQSNDNATIALAAYNLATGGEVIGGVAAAVERRQRINAIRAASNALERGLEKMTVAALADFSARSAPWPTF